jgi:hypothetical protein
MREGIHLDVVAKFLQTAHQALSQGLSLFVGKVQGGEFAVGGLLLLDMEDDDQEAVAQGDGGTLASAAGSDTGY